MILPTMIRIRKVRDFDNTTRYFTAGGDDEIFGVTACKVDFTGGKDLVARITFEVSIEEIEVVEPQLELPGMQIVAEGPIAPHRRVKK